MLCREHAARKEQQQQLDQASAAARAAGADPTFSSPDAAASQAGPWPQGAAAAGPAPTAAAATGAAAAAPESEAAARERAKVDAEHQQRRQRLEEASLPLMLDALWAGNVLDIETTLRHVCKKVGLCWSSVVLCALTWPLIPACCQRLMRCPRAQCGVGQLPCSLSAPCCGAPA